MEKEELFSEQDMKLIDQYIERLKYYTESPLCSALVYFLSKYSSSSKSIINKRKAFILKVLKECTFSGQLHIDLFPMEVEKKLVEAYKEEKQKEEDEKQAHVAELMEEMDEIF